LEKKNTAYIANTPREIMSTMKEIMSDNRLNWILAEFDGAHVILQGAIASTGRPCVWVDMQGMRCIGELTEKLWQEAIRLYGWKEVSKHLDLVRRRGRTNRINPEDYLQDTFRLLETLSGEDRNLIIVLNEVQECEKFTPPIDDAWCEHLDNQRYAKYIFVSRDLQPRDTDDAGDCSACGEAECPESFDEGSSGKPSDSEPIRIKKKKVTLN
jgi:hypothetical protein